MSLHVKRQGHYRLYETSDHRRKLLVLDRDLYDWLESQREDQLRMHGGGNRGELIGEGEYVLVQAEREPGWTDGCQYLGLSDGSSSYFLYKLDDGLPTDHRLSYPILSLTRMLTRESLERATA
jgi:hypothetical protein